MAQIRRGVVGSESGLGMSRRSHGQDARVTGDVPGPLRCDTGILPVLAIIDIE
jgi:hypothetical protein